MKKNTKQIGLRIKREYLDAIVEGTKKEEYRDFSPFYVKRFLIMDEEGDSDTFSFKNFDRLKLYVGNTPDAPYAIVKVTRRLLVVYENKIPEGRKKGDMEFVFKLGKVIDTNL